MKVRVTYVVGVLAILASIALFGWLTMGQLDGGFSQETESYGKECDMAVDFTGSGDGISFGRVTEIEGLTQKTVCFRVWLDSFGNDALMSYPFAYNDWTASPPTFHGWSLTVDNNFGVYSGPNGIKFAQTFSGTDGGWRWDNVIAADGTLYSVCITYDRSATGNDPILYVNGVAQSLTSEYLTPTGTADAEGANWLFILGNIKDPISNFNYTLDGREEDFRIYDFIASAQEVLAWSNGKLLTPRMATPVFWCPMTAAQGLSGEPFGGKVLTTTNYLEDWSAGKNHGTPVSGPSGVASLLGYSPAPVLVSGVDVVYSQAAAGGVTPAGALSPLKGFAKSASGLIVPTGSLSASRPIFVNVGMDAEPDVEVEVRP